MSWSLHVVGTHEDIDLKLVKLDTSNSGMPMVIKTAISRALSAFPPEAKVRLKTSGHIGHGYSSCTIEIAQDMEIL